LKGKTALVTGAGSGIGAEIARLFAAQGAEVACLDLTAEIARGTSEAIVHAGGRAIALGANVADASAVEMALKQLLESWKRIDICVNNAGITRDSLLLRMKEEDWDAVLNVNLKGVFTVTKQVIRPMLKQESGAICNVASVIGLMGNVAQANYAASKGGVVAFTKSCARELGSRGIRVNAVAPGFIETPMTAGLSPEVAEGYKKQISLGRFGVPRDVAGVVLFLCSDLAAYVTGQTIVVDGGMLMH
jgi:3-oxoacyl-[acyl-carrier protein] reductase